MDAVDSSAAVGRRVTVEGEKATVLFYGEVPPTKGVWLGVEWDRPGRGRHEGGHNGVSYFTPRSREPLSCSFLRPNKIDWGTSVAEAIRARYGEVEGQNAGVEASYIEELQKEIGARFVQVVGFDKINREQSNFSQLRTASVCNTGVSRAGKPEEVGRLVPKLEDLDLSENLFSSWDEVAAVSGQVPLKVLTVTENVLSVPKDFSGLVDSFSCLNHLVLGRMSYTWEDVVVVAGGLPSLEHLQVYNNRIDSIAPLPSSKFVRLKQLDLDGNNISSWSCVNNLSQLPCLENLRLNNNKVDQISLDNGMFPKLTNLQLSFNQISNWQSISELDKLKIREFRFRSNPVLKLEKNEETCRQIIVARIGSLRVLNSSEVAQDVERKWAEIDYLKKYGAEYLKIKAMAEGQEKDTATKGFAQNHPRYSFIVGKHGEPEDGEVAEAPTTLAQTLVKVTIVCPDYSEAKDSVKKLPPGMSVAKLRALLQRLYRKYMAGPDLKISLVTTVGDNESHEVEFDNDMRELSFYSVKEGDKIYVRF